MHDEATYVHCDFNLQTFFRDHCLAKLILTFSWTPISDCGWVIVLNDCNMVIGQESNTFFDEVAQEERQVDPYFHYEDGTLRYVSLRGCSGNPSGCKHPMMKEEGRYSVLWIQRQLKSDDPLAVLMRRDEQFPITQPKTDPIVDMNIMRMRPYFLGDVDDVEYRVITHIQWENASDIYAAVNTLLKTSLAHHSGSRLLHTQSRVYSLRR